MSVDHFARAKKAWPYLVKRAERGDPPFTYGELSALLGLHHRSARWFLGVIQEYCRRHKLPPLQALAVNKKTGLPGSGYVGSPRTTAEHKHALKRVRSKKWPSKAPNFST